MIMALIYRNVPASWRPRCCCSASVLSAQQALDAGIVNRVVPRAELDGAVADWAGS